MYFYSNTGDVLSGTRQFIDSAGIPENAKFIIDTDPAPNGGLYYINRQGWNVSDTSLTGNAEINRYISKGADYILFKDKKYISNSFNGIKIGEKNGVTVFKIKNGF